MAFSMRQVLLDIKPLKAYEKKRYYKKITTNISHEHRYMMINNIIDKWSLTQEYNIGLTFGNQSMQSTILTDLKNKTGYEHLKRCRESTYKITICNENSWQTRKI